MLITKKLNGVDKVKRKGVLENVKIPEKDIVTSALCCACISKKRKEIFFKAAEDLKNQEGAAYAILDEVGVHEECQFEVFLAGAYVVLTVRWGNIYFKDDTGTVKRFTKEGIIEDVDIKLSNIRWLKRDDFITYITYSVKNKYNLTNKDNIESYLNNLVLTVLSAYQQDVPDIKTAETKPLYSFKFKVIDSSELFGLDEFDFVVKDGAPNNIQNHLGYAEDYYNSLENQKDKEQEERKKELLAEAEYLRIKEGEDVVMGEEEGMGSFDIVDEPDLKMQDSTDDLDTDIEEY